MFVQIVYRMLYGMKGSSFDELNTSIFLVLDNVVQFVINRYQKTELSMIKNYKEKFRIWKSIVHIKTKVVIGMEYYVSFHLILNPVGLLSSIVQMNVEQNLNGELLKNIRVTIVPNEPSFVNSV